MINTPSGNVAAAVHEDIDGDVYEKPTVDVVPLEQVVRAASGSVTDVAGFGQSGPP